MKPVRLVFPSPRAAFGPWLLGHAAQRRVSAVGLLLLMATMGALLFVAFQSWQAREDLRAAQSAVEAVQTRSQHAARRSLAQSTAPQLSLQQSRAWNQVVRQLNTPWPAIFDALEGATPDTVALVAIEPQAQQASIRLQAEAKTLDTLLAWGGTLKTVPPFDDVLLIKHETNDQDATRPLRLSMDLRLKAQGK